MNRTAIFEGERQRLVGLATRVLSDGTEAEDVVQQAWIRLDRTETAIDNLAAWLTTVTVRLCLDRLRARISPAEPEDLPTPDRGPAEETELADSVGVALQVVLDRLTPKERVAFVLHDSFGYEFPTIATVLDTSPDAARQLASRARAKVRRPSPGEGLADWEVVDAFLAAARKGDFSRLLQLLAPGAEVTADSAAVLVGTPEHIRGRQEVATFFNGAAAAARAVFVEERPGAAWFDRGTARVAFDFTVLDGVVHRIMFRADPELLTRLRRRTGAEPRR